MIRSRLISRWLLYLVLRQVAENWKMPAREWGEARTQFAILFGDRFVAA